MRGKTAEDVRLLELLDPVAEAAGYEIVRLRLMGGDHRRNLQIMAEKGDGTMLVEDCTVLARAISEVLDAADPISGDYTLEVSSPGIDRPLTRLKDFATYQGYDARIELDRLAENRKRFKGVLAGVEDGNVAIDLEGEDETALIPFAWISDARLVITDALLKRGAEARAARMASDSPPPAGEGDREMKKQGRRAPSALRATSPLPGEEKNIEEKS
ncbi:MAG TPA: ribosome maturation factor RimP [Caulobacteraceae bacterium]|nr:ribosome maturation factor RimP [Caulobacteraceae bacterium]